MSKEAKPDTWMPVVIGNYKKHTGRLTRDLHGGYFLLQMEYWINGPLRDDDEELAAVVLATPRVWKDTIRPKLERFFVIEGGYWRHVDLDRELAEWAERKQKNIARAAAGGRATAAKRGASSGASSAPKAALAAALAGRSISTPGEVDGPTGHSTLSGKIEFLGPKEVRAAFLAKLGEDWCGSYLDPCTWQDVPERALIPATGRALDKIRQDGWRILKEHGLSVLERAA